VVPRYACLSHCWGPSQSPIRTLVETIDDFKKGIPWNSLSKTFQDAVETCRRLGIDHIWIDSLCIIQNSKDGVDWKEQSVQMADIYQNAFITIAATRSKDGMGGCFAERDAGHVNAHPVVDGAVYVRKEMPLVETRDFVPKDLPLLSRGWVHQEMALSPRVVHFCPQEVVWRCRHHARSESGSNYGGRRAVAAAAAAAAAAPDDDDHDDNNNAGPAVPDRAWYDTVHNYTHLALTFAKDRLPALAAVAQRAAADVRPKEDRYLAGLWASTLRTDLLWQAYPPSSQYGPAARPRHAGRAPSWSVSTSPGAHALPVLGHDPPLRSSAASRASSQAAQNFP
jgi:hypothetical protein